jgi:amino acid adenylation domain-containing protein
MGHQSLSCLVLGDEPLAIHCVQELLSRGHQIIGIVTQADVVLRWAHEQSIPVISREAYPHLLDNQAVDLLLAIAYADHIPKEITLRARVAAICYHDGHFPRRADMHSAAWSLVDGVRQHDIIWQFLTGDVGQGAVLEKRSLDIGPRETSVSLNMRNSAMALESFQALVQRLEQGNLQSAPLTSATEGRTLSREERPAALAVIDWADSSIDIDALVRACDFGQYPNPFAAAKLLHKGCALIVHAADPRETAVSAYTSPEAGQVTEVDDEAITVACGQGELRLKRLSTLTGDVLSARQALALLGLKVGEVLDGLAGQTAEALSGLSPDLARSEAFWLKALVQREAPSLPLDTGEQGAEGSAQRMELNWGHSAESAAAVFAFTLSCLMQQDRFDLAFVDASGLMDEAHLEAGCLLMPVLPLPVRIDATRGFDALLQAMTESFAQCKGSALLADVVARHPVLRAQADLRAGCISEIAVLLLAADAPRDQALPSGVRLAMVIEPGATVRLWLRSAEGVASGLVHEMGQYMAVVARKVALNGSLPLATVDVLDDAARSKQVMEWNATTRPFPEQLRIHELFEAQVALRPEAIALVCQGQTMTFAELERQANQVANVLQARGIGPGQYVAVLVERGFTLIATLIGVAKSGAAYLPIDPTYPTDRVHFVLGDANCVAAVVSPEFAHRCNIAADSLLLAGSEVFRSASVTRPVCASVPTDVCYTIYTSGSTGNPKGVVLTHRAVVNTLDWVNRSFGVGPADRLLFVTSPSFDLSVYDIFGALGAGASVDIATAALLSEPADLTQYVATAGITIWDSAPPALARLASFFPNSFPGASLRLVMLSGDWIPVWLPDKLLAVFPGVKVKSLGGATEAAIWSNYYPVDKVDPAWTSIPYGYPIQNARYYILDGHLRPVPVSIPGDLYIAGDCLAEGYLNREELTQERFILDPFHAGQRMYKTGDLARFWADGTMEFLGRSDFQVKIRGYRVEIGEVESALRALPGVRDAICTTWVDGADQKSLVAYLLSAGDAVLDPAAIKASLAAKLPDYMVPSYVMVLKALPLSANGKLDRKALPSPAESATANTYRTASTSMETALVGIWQEVLKRPQIGVSDNFFDIGGHSLLAVILMTKLRTQLQVIAPLSKLIEHPTIEQLAHYLETLDEGAMTPSHGLMELRKGGCRNFFLVHDGDGEVLLYRTLAQHLPAQFNVFGVPPRSLPRIPMADRTLEQMASSYVAEIRARQPLGPYYLGGLCAGGVIAFEMAMQLEHAGEKVGLVAIMDAVEPLTRPRAFLTSKRRWQRLASVFASASEKEETSARALSMVAAFGTAAKKALNVVRYETTLRIIRTFTKFRLRLLDLILLRGWVWPSFIPSLTPREIYVGAIGKYQPADVIHAPVVVMKASEGADADEPLIYQIEDPLLGWGRVSKGALEVMDVQGGHSSMLQMPHVEALARQFADVLPK